MLTHYINLIKPWIILEQFEMWGLETELRSELEKVDRTWTLVSPGDVILGGFHKSSHRCNTSEMDRDFCSSQLKFQSRSLLFTDVIVCETPVSMPLCASTGPALGRCCQHRPSTAVLATKGASLISGSRLWKMYSLCVVSWSFIDV